jgi:hypothetical protein
MPTVSRTAKVHGRSTVEFAVGEVGDRCGGAFSSVPIQAIPDRRTRGGWRILNPPGLARDTSPRENRRSSRSSQEVNRVKGRQRPPPWKSSHPCPGSIPPRHGRWQESPRAEPWWREGTTGAIPRSRSHCSWVCARSAPTQRYSTGRESTGVSWVAPVKRCGCVCNGTGRDSTELDGRPSGASWKPASERTCGFESHPLRSAGMETQKGGAHASGKLPVGMRPALPVVGGACRGFPRAGRRPRAYWWATGSSRISFPSGSPARFSVRA